MRYGLLQDEWHEIWRTESITCRFDYTYHPNVSKIASDLPLHVLQEFLPKPVEHPKDVSVLSKFFLVQLVFLRSD